METVTHETVIKVKFKALFGYQWICTNITVKINKSRANKKCLDREKKMKRLSDAEMSSTRYLIRLITYDVEISK